MDGLPSQLPDDPTSLKRLLQQQQRTIDQQRKDLDRKQQLVDRSQKKLNVSEQRVERFREKVIRKQGQIEHLEERLRRLLAHRFGRRSEKNADQFRLFNEAELLAEHADGIRAREICRETTTGKLLMLVQIEPDQAEAVKRSLLDPRLPPSITVFFYNHSQEGKTS